MSVTAVIVIFATLWFISLLVVLPIGIRTQDEAGDVAPGTPGSAPADPMIGKKLRWATYAAFAITIPLCFVIIKAGITIKDLDIWGIM